MPTNSHSKVIVSSKDGEEGSKALPLVLLKPMKEYNLAQSLTDRFQQGRECINPDVDIHKYRNVTILPSRAL